MAPSTGTSRTFGGVPVIPPELWQDRDVLAALSGCSVPAVLRAVKSFTGWTNKTIADLISANTGEITDEKRISAYLSGAGEDKGMLRTTESKILRGLQIPDRTLEIYLLSAYGYIPADLQEETDDMNPISRRNALTALAASVLAAGTMSRSALSSALASELGGSPSTTADHLSGMTRDLATKSGAIPVVQLIGSARQLTSFAQEAIHLASTDSERRGIGRAYADQLLLQWWFEHTAGNKSEAERARLTTLAVATEWDVPEVAATLLARVADHADCRRETLRLTERALRLGLPETGQLTAAWGALDAWATLDTDGDTLQRVTEQALTAHEAVRPGYVGDLVLAPLPHMDAAHLTMSRQVLRLLGYGLDAVGDFEAQLAKFPGSRGRDQMYFRALLGREYARHGETDAAVPYIEQAVTLAQVERTIAPLKSAGLPQYIATTPTEGTLHSVLSDNGLGLLN